MITPVVSVDLSLTMISSRGRYESESKDLSAGPMVSASLQAVTTTDTFTPAVSAVRRGRRGIRPTSQNHQVIESEANEFENKRH